MLPLRRALASSSYYYRVFGAALATVYDQDLIKKIHRDRNHPERVARSAAINRIILYLSRPVLVQCEFQAG